MNTPSKTRFEMTQTNTDDAMILTPFRGRAIEENRLRQAFRMSVTPGLKRRLQAQRSHSSWRSNPNELKLFINDMSESRYSNSGKNLMGQLQIASGEDSGLQKVTHHSESDLSKSNIEQAATPRSNIEDSSSTTTNTNESLTEMKGVSNKEHENATNNNTRSPPKRLSDLIFSQLKVVPREVKIRKLEPLEIKDAGLKPLTDVDSNRNLDNNNNNNTGFIFNNDPLPFRLPRTPPTVKPIYTDDNVPQTLMDDNNSNGNVGNDNIHMDIGGMDMDNFEEANGYDINSYNKDLDVVDHEYERSFTFGQTTPHIENKQDKVFTYSDNDKSSDYINNNIIKNGGGEAVSMVTKIRHLLIRSDGTFETDFDRIITFLNNNQLIMNDSMPSMNEIFEICCQYLDMSEINEIERVWFSYK